MRRFSPGTVTTVALWKSASMPTASKINEKITPTKPNKSTLTDSVIVASYGIHRNRARCVAANTYLDTSTGYIIPERFYCKTSQCATAFYKLSGNYDI